MNILLNSSDLTARKRIAAGALRPLADSLRADMDRVLHEAPAISGQKAMLSRDGGRCPHDGASLEFNPYSPHAHRCPVCGELQTREHDHRWWLMFAQLWRAERAVHAAALHALRGEPILAAFARATLDEYADRYSRYPLDDNVLGPSRPFFSTYLESIWLLQLCIAADLLDAAGAGESSTDHFRARVAAPSAALIRTYDEGESNRQLWNNAALIAAGGTLGDSALVAHAMHSSSGLIASLGTGLLADGSWYEGENYHLFSHRGLWYGVTMAEAAGHELPPELLARFQAAFSTPFLTAFPDLGFPARRDSQYGASLRQWRTAESCELGLARADDARLTSALAALYADDIPHLDTGRWRSAAEAERNEPASALTRADLGWRSLLFARETLPPLERANMASALLEGQGIAVFRRDEGKAYAALDYGHHGGGHGHPDRLNLLLAYGPHRILDDMGTGSYVDRSLHWYRSTLAHNAPLVNGRSQPQTSGSLMVYDERDGLGWIDACADISNAPEVQAQRAVVVSDSVCIDDLRWVSFEEVRRVELPIHTRGRIDLSGPWTETILDGGDGLEDGFSFVHDARSANAGANQIVRLLDEDSGEVIAWVTATRESEWFTAMAPGAPGAPEQRFAVVRMRGSYGRMRTVWNFAGAIADVTFHANSVITRDRAGDATEFEFTQKGMRVTSTRNGNSATTILDGLPEAEFGALDDDSSLTPPPSPPFPLPFSRELAESDYRMSEYSWSVAGKPSAHVEIDADDADVEIRVDVHKTPLFFRDEDAPDPALDNEIPDINSDGVQLHLWCDGWREPASWLVIPSRDFSHTRIHRLSGGANAPTLTADSRETIGGYEVRLAIPRDALTPIASIDVLINDMISTRQRRRGQLVLSGARGERIYLRGDRQPLERFLRIQLPE
ncbi:MAG: heparinase II/III family protein [Gemmatimonadaceae bacterium]